MHAIHLWAPEFSEGGGIQSFSAQVACALRTDDVKLFAQREGRLDGFPISFPRKGGLLTARFAAMLVRKAVRDRPRIILSTHLNFGPVARIIKRVLGIPYVLVAHGIEIHPNLSRRRLSGLAHADVLLGVSQHSIDRLRGLPLSPFASMRDPSQHSRQRSIYIWSTDRGSSKDVWHIGQFARNTYGSPTGCR